MKVKKIFNPVLHAKLVRMEELQAQMREIQIELQELDYYVRQNAVSEFINLYKENGEFPGSFECISVGPHSPSYKFIPNDRYHSIDQGKAIELQSRYGDGVVEKVENVSLNPEIVRKYEPIIREWLKRSRKIDKNDRSIVLVKRESWKIKEGSIKKTIQLGENSGLGISQVISDLRPVFALKKINLLSPL